MINTIVRQGAQLTIFRTKLVECPEALCMVMAVASHMVAYEGLRGTPWNNASNAIIASDGTRIVGFIVYGETGTSLEIEFVWVEPGLRGEGIFDNMLAPLSVTSLAQYKSLTIKDGFMTETLSAVLVRSGFVGREYLPFKKWAAPTSYNMGIGLIGSPIGP